MDFIKSNGSIEPIDISEVGITDGLVGWWPLNGNANDITLNKNNGTVTGATVASGLNGLCYSFDGVGDIINFSSITCDFTTNDFSVSLWANFGTSTVPYQRLFGKKGVAGATAGYSIYRSGTTNKLLWSTANGSVGNEYWSNNSFTAGVWHHIVMIRKATDTRVGYFYMDSIREEITTIPSVLNVTSTNVASIGADPSLNANLIYTGLIEDVRIYNRALSEQEIKIQYELYKNKKMNVDSTGKLYTAGKIIETY